MVLGVMTIHPPNQFLRAAEHTGDVDTPRCNSQVRGPVAVYAKDPSWTSHIEAGRLSVKCLGIDRRQNSAAGLQLAPRL
jgi:hypothetical protein